jgi:sugar phosphate permease
MAEQVAPVIRKPAVGHRRIGVYIIILFLVLISYLDRIALSVAGPAVSKEFHLSPITMGYLFSAFFWMYTITMVPAGCF